MDYYDWKQRRKEMLREAELNRFSTDRGGRMIAKIWHGATNAAKSDE